MKYNNTLNALKSRLNEKGNMKIIAEQGHIHTIHCSFNPPIEVQEIKKKSVRNNWLLPEDYKDFLKQHNGVRIFELLLNDENIGGGLHLYSIQEIQKTSENLKLDSQYVPIGYVLENHLLISNKDIKQNNPNYLFIAGTSFIPKPLNLNFELFLDRFIISQGANFWEWPYYTAENYYKYSNGIEF